MYQILQRKYYFFEPIALQKNHLKDIYHIDKAHWITLAGVKVSGLKKLSEGKYEFNLTRNLVNYTVGLSQTDDYTEIVGSRFRLRFVIIPLVEGHYLQVTLFSIYSWIRWFNLMTLFLFWLTIVEDRVYFFNVFNRNKSPLIQESLL